MVDILVNSLTDFSCFLFFVCLFFEGFGNLMEWEISRVVALSISNLQNVLTPRLRILYSILSLS